MKFLKHLNSVLQYEYRVSKHRINIFKLLKYVLRGIVILIPIYLTLLGIFSHVLEQYDKDIKNWPSIIEEMHNGIKNCNYISYRTLQNLLEKDNPNGKVKKIIIAIDISGSVDKQIENHLINNDDLRSQYINNLADINGYIKSPSDHYHIDNIKKYGDILKLKACVLLQKCLNDSLINNNINKKFSIVTFGDSFEQIVPEDEKIDFEELNTNSVKSAIPKIMKIKCKDYNTDYAPIIRYVNSMFPVSKSNDIPVSQLSNANLIIYSDLIHDRQKALNIPYDTKKRAPEKVDKYKALAFDDSIKLIKEFKTITSKDLFSNVIIINQGNYHKKNDLGKFNIWPILHKYFYSNSINLIPLHDHDQKVIRQDYIVPHESSLVFHYSNENSFINDSAGIIFDEIQDDYGLEFQNCNFTSLVANNFEDFFLRKNVIQNYPLQSISYSVLKKEGNDPVPAGKLIAYRLPQKHLINLQVDDTLMFHYKSKPNFHNHLHEVVISPSKLNYNFRIPIVFKQKLSSGVAGFLFYVYNTFFILIGFVIILFLIFIIEVLMEYLFLEKSTTLNKPQDNGR